MEAVNDLGKWMESSESNFSGDVDNDDEAPEEVQFGQSRQVALAARQDEVASQRRQQDELKRKRKEIEQRNIVQKQQSTKAAIAELPTALLEDVEAAAEAQRRRQLEADRSRQDQLTREQDKELERKQKRRVKVSLPDTTYEFIPLAGVERIPQKLVYKNKSASLQLNFKERMLYDRKRVKREKVGHILARREKRQTTEPTTSSKRH